MTEKNTTTSDVVDEFDDAKEEFASKDDLRDRLVLVWPTGKTGTRKSESTGKQYDWVETTTLVIDDGPNWSGQIMDSNTQTLRDALVPSVAEAGPTTLENFQFSFGGMVSRLKQRLGPDGKPKTFAPMLGRINSRPNKTKGMAPSWSVASPTDADKVVARKFTAQIRAIREAMESAGKPEGDEFDD